MTMIRALIAAMTLATPLAPAALAQTPADAVSVYAAGSLRAAMTDLADAYQRSTGHAVRLTFGASGLLKARIEAGEAVQVFASANMTHPEALLAAGKAQAVRPFARNALCALASSGFALKGKTLAQRLLEADVRVGTSTPRADPSGDYAFQMFDRIESSGAAGAGSAAALKAKALQLTGGPDSPPPPQGRNVYGQLVADGAADVFITYCTNATEARRQVPALQVLPVPESINVSAVYGIATLKPVTAPAQAFVDFVTGAEGQKLLGERGFSAP